MYALRLLGGVAIEGPDGPATGYASQPRQLALLAVLAVAYRDGISRDKLLGCLWPDAEQDSARHSLTDALYRLRKELGPAAIDGRSTTLRLNASVVRADVVDFERALESGDPATAVELYGGPFLDGFHLTDSVEFEHWKDAEARRLDHRAQAALEALIDCTAADDDPAGTMRWLHRLFDMDPYNSRTVLRMMEALAATGDPANAVKLAAEHTALLADELGVEPPAELLELARRLHGPDQRRTKPAARTRPFPFDKPSSRSTEDAFVARETELARLHALLDGVVDGRGRVVFVSGEAGTGKTAVVAEFCRQAIQRVPDLVVAGGNCNAHTGAGDPYLPFREILDLLSGGVEARWSAGSIALEEAERLWDLLPDTARTLATRSRDLLDTFIDRSDLIARLETRIDEAEWLAGLGALRKHAAAGSPVTPQPALFTQYVRLVHELSRDRTLLLTLDDLQWADRGSIGLLFQLGRQLDGHRIMVIGLFRPSDVAMGRDGARHPVEPVINELERTYGNVEVTLDDGGDRAFIDALVDARPNVLDASFRDTLYRQTQGHALFTVELLRVMRDTGMLELDGRRWRATQRLDWSLVPARIQAMLAERIGRLPDGLQRILAIASVEGETFTLEVVAAVADVPVEDLLIEVSRELQRRFRLVGPVGIERVAGNRVATFRFTHVLFQRHLYEHLDDVERSHLHERVGLTLETLLGDTWPRAYPRLAHHFAEAGRAGKAARYFFEAGVHAGRAAAFSEAASQFESALVHLMALPESHDRDRLELEIQSELGHARIYAALPEQVAPFERAGELAERLQDDRLLFRALIGLYLVAGHYPGNNRTGRVRALDALAVADRTGDGTLLAIAHESLGRNTYMRGRFRAALASYLEGQRLCDPAADVTWSDLFMDLEPSNEGMIGLIKGTLGFADQARAHMAQATALARNAIRPVTLIAVLWYDVLFLLDLRDAPAVLDRSRELAEAAQQLGVWSYWGPLAGIADSWVRAHAGQLEAGLAAMRKALTDYLDIGFRVGQTYFNALLAELLAMNHRAEEGLELMDESIARAADMQEFFQHAEMHRLRGDLLRAQSTVDTDAAEREYRRAIDLARTQEARLHELRATTSLARLLHGQGRAAEARPVLGAVYAWFTEGFDTPDLKAAKALLAELG